MITLSQNYQKNLDILKENIKRGMNINQVNSVINHFESQFINANLYNQSEKDFINEMRALSINSFSHITVVNN